MFLVKGVVEFFNEDTDRVFSYNTKQQVMVQHWFLGFTENLVRMAIAAYVIFYVLYWNEGYYEEEPSKGDTLTYVSGSSVAGSLIGSSASRFFSAEDINYPGLENGNVFVTTKIDTFEQSRRVCEDEGKPCQSAKDCSQDVGAKCSENGFCIEPSWCVDDPHGGVMSFKPETFDFRIWVKSSIEFFTKGQQKVQYHNDMERPIMYPEPGYNTFTVRDLLLLCDPPTRYEEIAELGAAIEVQIHWKCSTRSMHVCRPKIRSKRIDNIFDPENIGFSYSMATYLGPDQRIKEQRHGIRLYFKTVGEGSRLSMQITIFKMSTGGALLVLAPIVVDLVMLHFMSKRRRYRARKFIITPDFDFMNEIEDVEIEVDDDDEELMGEQEDEEWKHQMDEND